MITKEEFEKLAEIVETHCEVEREIDKYKFWRTFTVKNARDETYKLTWFQNALIVNQGAFEIHIMGDIKVQVSGTWPRHTKLNIQIFSEDNKVHTIIPIVFYEINQDGEPEKAAHEATK